MRNSRQKKYYQEYLFALKKLIDAQNRAREYFPAVPLRPTAAPSELTSNGRKVLQRLNKAYETYAEKSKAWRDFIKISE